MALEYFLYTTLYNNTLVDRSDTTFVPLPPNTGQILIDYFIPTIQPLYYYRESVATIVLNDEATIDAYLTGTAPPPQGEDDVIQSQFTGYTATTNIQISGIENNISYLSGQTDTKLAITNFNSFTGTTLPLNYYNKTQINTYSASTLTNINSRLLKTDFNGFTGTTLPTNYYNKTQINNYTGATNTLIGTKIDKVTGATATDIATFVTGGNVQDSGKQFITTVNPVGSATDTKVATELAVRTAINQAITGAIILQGDWNAATNTPDLTVTGITTGFAWRVSVSGTTNLGGITSWAIGDMAVKSATGWVKIDNEDISAIWGNIYGTLSNQTDLQLALNAKQNTITGAATSITTTNLTINRALVSDASGKVAVSTITSTQLGYLSGTTSNIQAQINLKAPLASPALTGTPTAPTAALNTSTTQLATTAFVTNQASSVLPVANCIAGATGTSLQYSRQDHRHPIATANNAVVFTNNTVLTGSTAFIYTGNTLTVPKVRFTAPSTGGTLSDYSVVWNPVTKEVRTVYTGSG